MKKLTIILLFFMSFSYSHGQEVINLAPRSQQRGTDIMKTLEQRKSSREYDTRNLSDQDLSDLLWAARGVNREDGKLTAPTAQNSQDVDVYVCTGEGVFIYDAPNHAMVKLIDEDIRPLLEGRRPTGAPVCLLIVSDMSRYRGYAPDSKDLKHYYEMGAVDSGIVSQNISIFCSAVDLATVPRAGMDQEGIRAKLELTETQFAWLNHPVGYPGVRE